MKILFYRSSYNPDFESLIQAISKTKNTFGYIAGEINEESVISFGPDIIVHNIPDVDKFPITNAISININNTDSKQSFSLEDKNSPNYIKPFVSLKSITVKDDEIPKYSSDIVHIGSPVNFFGVIDFLANEESDVLFKFFTHKVHNINGYCGLCDVKDYLKFYKYSKGCLVMEDDIRRLMDIVVAGGNPIVFNGNSEDCIQKIKNAVYKNEKFSVPNMTKELIMSKDTAFDRASEIFKKVGLLQVAENILKSKDWDK